MRTIRIGPIQYRLVYEENLRGEDDEKLWGKTRHGPAKITLSNEIDPQQRYECLWHELIHTILSQAGYKEDGQREDLIEALSHGIMGIIRDNPWMQYPPQDGNWLVWEEH
jgi:hypothetical protein